MYVFADLDTSRLLRALALQGPSSAAALAAHLHLPHRVVRRILTHTLRHGVVHQRHDDQPRYELDPAALSATVTRIRDELLGATA